MKRQPRDSIQGVQNFFSHNDNQSTTKIRRHRSGSRRREERRNPWWKTITLCLSKGVGQLRSRTRLASPAHNGWKWTTYLHKYGRPEIRWNMVLGTAPAGVSGNSEIKRVVIRDGRPAVVCTPGRRGTSGGTISAEQE